MHYISEVPQAGVRLKIGQIKLLEILKIQYQKTTKEFDFIYPRAVTIYLENVYLRLCYTIK